MDTEKFFYDEVDLSSLVPTTKKSPIHSRIGFFYYTDLNLDIVGTIMYTKQKRPAILT